MKKIEIVFFIILTVLLFLLWAGFAILVINPYMSHYFPGYTEGQLCIWELVALIVASIVAHLLIKSWGYPTFTIIENREQLVMDKRYVYFLIAYFIIGVIIVIWQFLLFSSNFS